MSASPSDQPLISVALCAYNGERYLREQLDSILAQEDVRLEVVAVDDCSTDGTLALLQHYAARDPRIRVHANEANLGHLRSFEKCMGLCTGHLIAPSDQDDVWHPRKLRRLLDALEGAGADLAYCDSEYIDGEGRKIGGRISDDLDAMHSGRDPLVFVFQNSVSGHALLVRKETFEAARPFPTLLYHDWWLAMCAAAGKGVVFVDEPLVGFRRHDSAFSSMGKQCKQELRKPKAQRRREAACKARNRKWLEERLYLLDAFAATSWRGHEQAAEWSGALRELVAGQALPLAKLAWRDRASLPPFRGNGWYRAYRFYRRCRRKVRRARSEMTVSTPLFRA